MWLVWVLTVNNTDIVRIAIPTIVTTLKARSKNHHTVRKWCDSTVIIDESDCVHQRI